MHVVMTYRGIVPKVKGGPKGACPAHRVPRPCKRLQGAALGSTASPASDGGSDGHGSGLDGTRPQGGDSRPMPTSLRFTNGQGQGLEEGTVSPDHKRDDLDTFITVIAAVARDHDRIAICGI